MKKFAILFAGTLLCAAVAASGQDKTKSTVKFGKVSPDDFTVSQSLDSGASAVIISDIGNSVIVGNIKGWFSLLYKRTKRIKIISKNGFDAAKIEIPLYSSGTAEETLDELKAYTYNLENGKVEMTKLEAATVFKDKLNKNYVVRKFTFPAVREGSVIEYSYTIKSDFLSNLQPWYFQSEYPTLWSEYQVDLPEFFNYVTINQGYLPSEVKKGDYNTKFNISIPGGSERNEAVSLDGAVHTTHWLSRNVPPLKEEEFTSAVKNYVSGVEFQLASYRIEGGMVHDQMGNWMLMGQKLMDNEYFGAGLTRSNGWLDDDIKSITKGASTKMEKARLIFAYVRDKLTCTDHDGFYLETNLKDAFKKHSGNVADINLLLVAMLRHEGIAADPVLLSTRNNGFTSELYPLLQRFNYVICSAVIDSNYYSLDASSPYNAFGMLPTQCYNGHARVITKEAAMPVYFEPDSLKEKEFTSVFISNDEHGGLQGVYKSNLGYYKSLGLRNKLKGDASAYVRGIKSGNSFDFKVVHATVDSLAQPDMPVAITYEFEFKPSADEGIVYFNPMLAEGYKKNPFSAASRTYPVEMPYTTDDTYLLNMEIPEGYVVEEIPKSVRVAYNGDEGSFEYLVQKSTSSIQLRSRIKLNKATFTPEDYNSLRDFFSVVVKKQNEQIVLKKK